MALGGAIVFNNQSGSDSQASGYSSQNPTVALSVGIQISSFSTTTSSASWTGTLSVGDLVYAPSSTGRKFNVISAVNNQVGFQSITFDVTWDTNISGTVYCGGKRSTLNNSDSRRLFKDGTNGDHPSSGTTATAWQIEVEYTGTDYTLSSQLVRHCQRELTGTDPNGNGDKPTIVCSFSNAPVSETESGGSSSGSFGLYFFTNLIFKTSVYRSETQPYFEYANGGTHRIEFIGCEMDGSGGSSGASLLVKSASGPESVSFESCKLTVNQYTSAGFTGGLYAIVGDCPLIVTSCRFVLDPSATVKTNSYGVIESGSGAGAYILACVMDGLANGYYQANGNGYTIGSIYYDVDTAITRQLTSACMGNVIHSCPVGISSTSSQYGPILANGFYNVTTSLGGFASNNSIEFTSDPLTDPANGDMSFSSSGDSEVAAIGSIYTPVVDGAPPLSLNPLRMFDVNQSSGGSSVVTMNGGING